MRRLKKCIDAVAVLVFVICAYTFLLGNEVFEGEFKNDAIAWYFLAKGIFCSVSLSLSVRVLETLSTMKKGSE